MFNQTFYHRTIRKYVTYFGTLFNDIYINRDDGQTGNAASYATLRVPISYGPKQKTLARLDGDPNLTRPTAIVLPRMSFEIESLSYDSSRKLTTINKGHLKTHPTAEERLKYVYNPVPYDIDFSLNIYVKNAEDGTRILEQILPYFTPDWTATLYIIPELDVKMDIPVVIKNVTSEDTYEGGFEERRLITWKLDFTMKGYLFGPIKSGGVITLANVNFYTSNSSLAISPEENVTIIPGLLANGSPTTNSQLTIDRTLIKESDDWDYIITTTSV
jgi:hypothetical protein